MSFRHLYSATRAALVFEYAPTNGREWKILTGRKGRAEVKIRIEGKSAHAGHPELGANAIPQMAKLIPQIEELTNPNAEFPPMSAFAGAGKPAMLFPTPQKPPSMYAPGKSRSWTKPWKSLMALQGEGSVRCTTDGFHCKVNVEIAEVTGAWDPDNPASQVLLATWKEAGEELGIQVESYERGGSSDGNFLAAHGLPTLDGPPAVGVTCTPAIKGRNLSRPTLSPKRLC